jgi:thiol:disulfide interchange protein DsbC
LPAQPVDETRKLAESLGVTATPTLILPDGRLLLGYKTADDLKKLLAEGEKPK